MSLFNLPDLVGENGIFMDGDWVESKDQDPNGDVRLIQLADVGDGEYINKSDRFLTSQKAAELRCTYLKPGDILVSRMPDPLGKACIFPGDSKSCVTVVDVCIVRPDPKIAHSRWLLHKINSPEFRSLINTFATGTTRKRISRKNLGSLEFPLPPLAEQQRIAAILDQANMLRAKRRAALAKLDTLLQSTFLHLFGDPVTNPMRWEMRRLDQFGKITTGSTPSRKKPEYYGDHIEWIKSDNINTPYHVLTPAQEYLSETGIKVGRGVPENSILITCIAGSPDCIGNAAIADRPVAFNQQINALTPKQDGITYFLYIQFLVGKRLVQGASTNSMKGMVSKSSFSSVEFMSPPLEMQRDFSRKAMKIQSEVDKQTHSLEKFDNLFHALQQRAFKDQL